MNKPLYDDDETLRPFRLFETEAGQYSLVLYDSRMAPSVPIFEEHGRTADGCNWTDVLMWAVRRTKPQLEGRFGLDPEAGMLCAYGTDLEALKALGRIGQVLFNDQEALAEAVRAAPYEYD